jgi:lysophospholipase L1-like esterase
MRLFIFGDSVTQGFWDKEGGWVQRLTKIIYEESLGHLLNSDGSDYVEVYNLGVSGDTTAGVLKRLKKEVDARRTYDEEESIILAIGLNDSILKADNTARMDVYQFQESYEKLINEAKGLAQRVYCLGLIAVDEKQTSPWPYSSSGKQWRNMRINLFEDAIKQSAERLSVDFLPIHDAFIAQLTAGEILLADGLHPNESGHELIARLVLVELSKV